MARGNTGFLGSTVSLKIGTSVLVLVVSFHATGFSLAKWCTLKFYYKIYYGTQSSWHAGLWQHNGCVQFDKEECTWFYRSGGPAWLKAVQAMETLGLTGFSISGITSLVLVWSKRGNVVKIFNLLMLIGSDVCIIIGLVIFGVEHEDDFKAVYAIADDISVDAHAILGVSFYLCAVAAGICSFVCVPLFIIDMRQSEQTDLKPQTIGNTTEMQQMNDMPVDANAEDDIPIPYGPQITKPVQHGTRPPKY